ncbi:transcription factor IIA, alpha/beta subunit [Ascobolus immersus RN42]|uniref:Transcription factor IIA, alpha/beta subunit n=1 Tax=Ascobolus immersus RN42 TaxID=1160509 RepID=A0A3N4J0C4_ASCIM|nr:transcription factor IIA, alpha/beta subunit [Ascobolus immersus RN42]
MSNAAVGDVYQKIINDVLDSSGIDFEEAGVASVVLHELGAQWRKKLTDLRVATFPWDPAPQQPQPIPDNKKVNNSMQAKVKSEIPQQLPQQQQHMQHHPHQLVGGVHLKQEPNDQDGLGAINPNLAAMRAAQNIQMKYPTQEVPSGLQQVVAAGARPNGARPTGPGLMLPGSMGQSQIPQHDGASDIRPIPADEPAWRSNSGGVISREEADRIIERQMAEGRGMPQMDGPDDDDDEEDEDAINSDLDDPDEDDQGEAEDDEIPQIMLCTYEKVQRTKNKWKCVLKDGVLTVNGREYVFRKANGEYEW